MLLLATRPSGGFTEVKRQKSKVGQKAVASDGSSIEGEHDRGVRGSDSLVNVVFALPKFSFLLHARMCWPAIMGKVIGSQCFQMQPVSAGAESPFYLHRMWSIYII